MPAGFDAALGDVAVEQVHAAGVALLAALGEQLPDGNGGVGGAAGTQVITVRVHHGGPVPGRADHPLWLGGAGIALDGVQRKAELA
jgi:hypothetical protein